MSWMLGALGPRSPEMEATLKNIAARPLFQHHGERLFLLAGGIPDTCKSNATEGCAWVVCGLGIERAGTSFRFLTTEDWDGRLNGRTDIHLLEGQFAGVSYSNGEVTLFTDLIGSRDLYFTIFQGVTLFSTRVDWLARLTGTTEINLAEFGGRWLFFYQLSTRSIIKNIERLGPGTTVTIASNGISRERVKWLPQPALSDFARTLEELTTFPFQSGHRLTLGLSGGLDSRLLFSLLLQSKGDWDVHTFGSPDHPDVIIAKQIASAFGVP